MDKKDLRVLIQENGGEKKLNHTLPETSIAPENGGPLEKEIGIGNHMKPPFLGANC